MLLFAVFKWTNLDLYMPESIYPENIWNRINEMEMNARFLVCKILLHVNFAFFGWSLKVRSIIKWFIKYFCHAPIISLSKLYVYSTLCFNTRIKHLEAEEWAFWKRKVEILQKCKSTACRHLRGLFNKFITYLIPNINKTTDCIFFYYYIRKVY